MDSSLARVLLALTCSAILGVEGAPYPSNGGLNENEGEGRLSSVALMDDSFYQEFPKVVDPSAKSRFLEHVEDMTFIKKEGNSTRTKRNAVLFRENLWPGGIIPYEIAPSYDAFERRIILKAMAHWEEHTCIRFYPKRSSDHYSIYINNTRPFNCSSFIGRILFRFQRKQVVSLGDGCVSFSTAVHEFGHAIGFYHEHNRNDRDEYITVYPERYFYPSQVEKQRFSNTLGKGYDYASIMHHSGYRNSLVSKIQAPFGNAEELSPLDIAKVNLLYSCGNCNNRPPLRTVVPKLTSPESSCGQLIETSQSGSYTFPNFQSNTQCNFVVAAPEGYFVEYHVQLLGSNLDSSTSCENSYIAFYDGATVESHRVYNYSPKPRFCTSNEFRFIFILPSNVTTVSYQAGGSRPQPVRVNYDIRDINECRIARQCQSCVNTAGSYKCTCSPGFYLSYPARTCYDVNECACGNGGCEHNCTNTAGSYSCSCRSGYYLQADGKSCGTRRPSTTPWKVIPGSLNTKSCPISFSIPNQPPAVTTIKQTTPPATLPTMTKAPVMTPLTLPTEEDIQVVTSSTINGYDTVFSTPGWPNEPYPLSRNFEWMLQCPNGADLIDVKFEENFKVAGKMPDCTEGQVYVYSNGIKIKVGGPFCYTTAPEPMESLDAGNTKVTFNSGTRRGSTRTGFGIRFQCRLSPTLPPPATEKPTTLPTTATTTVPPITTMIPTTTRPTTLPTTARPTTARPTSQTTPLPVTVGPCGPEVITTSSRNAFDSIFSTPGWPDEPYPLNVVCEWRLGCPSASDLIDIQFEGNFKIAGKMPDCPKDQINVYSKGAKVGGPFCHTTAPEQIESLDASSTRVTLDSGSGRGSTRTGFAVRFRCRATSFPTTPLSLTTAEPTTPSPTTVMPNTQTAPPPSCGGVITAPSRYEYYFFSTPGWPDAPYPLNMNCEWLLQCPSVSNYIDIRFAENFKVAGEMPSCSKDEVNIESNGRKIGPFCHLTCPDPITFLDAHSTKVTFQAGGNRGVTRTGFGVQFQCR